MEFDSFDPETLVDLTALEGGESFKDIIFDYDCNLHIYSLLGDTALSYAESQVVSLSVPFGYSQYGALDANVDKLLFDVVDSAGFKFLNVINKLNKITRWIRFASQAYGALMSVVQIFNFVKSVADGSRGTVMGQGAATASCTALTVADQPILKLLEGLGAVLDIVSCNPQPDKLPESMKEGSGLGGVVAAYAKWQRTVLDWYNNLRGAAFSGVAKNTNNEFISNLFLGASQRSGGSLYDNIIVSTVGLCIPGIIHNLDKYAQIECTYIKCLNEDVKEGITTVDVCQKSKAYLYCKHIVGEFLGFIPKDPLSFIMDYVKSIILDPIGAVVQIVSIACGGSFCPTTGSGKVACDVAGFFYFMLDVANNIFGLFAQFPAVKYNVCAEPGVVEVIDNYKANKDAQQSSSESVTSDSLSNTVDAGDSDE